MFKHLLLATDGSPSSESAVRRGLELAKEAGARVTAVHVVPEFHAITYQVAMLEDTRERFLKDCQAAARKILAGVERQAGEIGIDCSARMATHDHPYEAIDLTAREDGCDLIVVGSHGHRGLRGLLLGSEMQKLLTHTTIPVLVLR